MDHKTPEKRFKTFKNPEKTDQTTTADSNATEMGRHDNKPKFYDNPNYITPPPRDMTTLDEHKVPKDWVKTTKFGAPMFIEELPFCILPMKSPIENPGSVKQLAEQEANFTWTDALASIQKKFKNMAKTPVVTNVIDLTGTEMNDRRYSALRIPNLVQ